MMITRMMMVVIVTVRWGADVPTDTVEVNDESGDMQVLVLMSTLGGFSNDGGDDKENAKKATSLKSTVTI